MRTLLVEDDPSQREMLTALREHVPSLLIGIGDRTVDVDAYRSTPQAQQRASDIARLAATDGPTVQLCDRQYTARRASQHYLIRGRKIVDREVPLDIRDLELGGQFTAAKGFHKTGVWVNGVKIRPSFTSSNPSGAISMCCGTIASPVGNGWVGEVYCLGSCMTGVSTIPISGLPVVRSSM